MYYAIENPYGLRTLNSAGPRANKLYRFRSRAGRDKFVAADPERRDPIKADSALVVRLKRWIETGRAHWQSDDGGCTEYVPYHD